MDDFYDASSPRTVKRQPCKSCALENDRKWAKRNPDKIRFMSAKFRGGLKEKEWRKKNRDIVLKYGKDWRKNNPDKVRSQVRRKTYNLSDEKFEQMMKDQDGKCLICKIAFDFSTRRTLPQIDHDHACCDGGYSCGSCIRGLLCGTCNNGLGCMKDDPLLLEAAIRYLRGNL